MVSVSVSASASASASASSVRVRRRSKLRILSLIGPSGIMFLLIVVQLLWLATCASQSQQSQSWTITHMTVLPQPYAHLLDMTTEELYNEYLLQKSNINLDNCLVLYPIRGKFDELIDFVRHTSQVFDDAEKFVEEFPYCESENLENCLNMRKYMIAECYKTVMKKTANITWTVQTNSIGKSIIHSILVPFHPQLEDLQFTLNEFCIRFSYNPEQCSIWKANVYTLQQHENFEIGLSVRVAEYWRALNDTSDNTATENLDIRRQGLLVHCPHSRKRKLVSYHKTGTTFGLSLMRFVNNHICRSCLVDIHINGVEDVSRDDFTDSHIVHFIRNPWDMILSSYFYHLKSNEMHVHLPMLFIYKIITFFGSWNAELPSIPYVYRYIITHPDTYPPPHELTYQQYLRSISPALGVRLEYVRSISSNIPAMVRDMVYFEELEAHGSVVAVRVCMSTLMITSRNHSPINNWHTLRRIVEHDLAISLTEEMEFDLATHFYTADSAEGHSAHSTERSELRLDLLNELRDFDLTWKNGGLVRAYEQRIGCPKEVDYPMIDA